MNLIHTINTNFTLLQNDFTGIAIHVSGIVQFFLHILIALSIFTVFYLCGEKIRKLFFREYKKYQFFISVALGYILIGTGIAVLGVFSLLQREILWVYFVLIVFIALIGVEGKVREGIRWVREIRWIKITGRENFIVWGVLLFVLIAFLRLMTPEITEDGYHTDLPLLYLTSQTTMHEARDPLRVIPYTQLAEMIYVIPIFLGDKEAVRFLHFGFYLLILFLFYHIAKYQKSYLFTAAPLLFATTPVVIRYTSSQYVDFFMLFFFLLSIVLIQKNVKPRSMILSGIIFGAVLSIKMWTLVYIPAILLYFFIINKKQSFLRKVKLSIFFVSFSLCVPLIWYIRNSVITGSPIYPLFAKPEYLEKSLDSTGKIANYFGFNLMMFGYQNMIVLSPLFFLGVLFCLFYYREVIKKIKGSLLIIFLLVLTVEQLTIKVMLGRHILAWYSFALLIASAGFVLAWKRNFFKYASLFVYFILFIYYFFNTMMTLPYGFGWADRNAYLTRVLGRDNASYYDFDHLFNKWISEKDLVATYGIYGYYYADFSYIDVNYIFSKNDRSFDLLKRKKATKLLVKGGDIEWFCKVLSLTQCDKNKVQLVATWPADVKKYNLYKLK